MSEQPTARPFDDPWLQAGQDSQLEAVRRRYERTGNPLYVWRGYDICRDLLDKNVSQARHPFPTWILDYLDRVTNSLWQLHNEGLSNQQKTAPLILQAFGMSGSVFQDWDKYEAVTALGAQVARTLARHPQRPGYGLDQAIADVAKVNGTTPETVRREYDLYLEERANGI